MKNILRPSKVKIILNILVSLSLVSAAIFLPALGFSGIFSKLDLGHKTISFLISSLIGFIIYYPFVSGLVHLANSVKNSNYNAKEIISALVLIAIFNPGTISLIVHRIASQNPALPASTTSSDKGAAEQDIQPESFCGFRIADIVANSKVKEAGIGIGDIIMKFNGTEVKSVQDILEQLAKKKPADLVPVETNRGVTTVELVGDPDDPNLPVMGVKLEPVLCGNN